MRPTTLLLLFLVSSPALSLDATCEIYLNAAEKSASQPARHSITEPGDGTSLEMVMIDGQHWSRVDGRWAKFPGGNLLTAERSMVAAIRSGRYPISNCRKLGSERFEGVATTVIAYTLKMRGTQGDETRAYVGNDGLVYGQVSGNTRVRHRYTNVKSPLP
jgi:hypothetical protein